MVLKELSEEELEKLSPEARAAYQRLKYISEYRKSRSYYERIKKGIEELKQLGIYEPSRRRASEELQP